jgi:seryl-tRNA synthetase
MIHLNYLKENTDFVIERLRIKNFEAGQYVEEILLLDKTRRSLQKQLDDNFAEQNKIAKEIGMLFKQGKSNEAQTLKDKTATLKTDAKSIEEALTATEVKLNDILVLLPNIPHASVPKGKSADDNEVVYIYGDINTDSHMLPHWVSAKK